ncbi:MAG: hypothetical protein WBO88_15585 [Candidatus Dechloromonas phosphoritropha]|nr:hypothetical protein [Azonexus sp.]MBP9226972.1 hypothetical protein [Azonexus sp.]
MLDAAQRSHQLRFAGIRRGALKHQGICGHDEPRIGIVGSYRRYNRLRFLTQPCGKMTHQVHNRRPATMQQSVFIRTEFFLLILFSLVVPLAIYAYMMWKRAISRKTVFFLAIVLIVLAGIDILLLQKLKGQAELTSSLIDNALFSSELSLALYLLPALFAGVGINMMSHLLISHLSQAERQFDREHPTRNGAADDAGN